MIRMRLPILFQPQYTHQKKHQETRHKHEQTITAKKNAKISKQDEQKQMEEKKEKSKPQLNEKGTTERLKQKKLVRKR